MSIFRNASFATAGIAAGQIVQFASLLFLARLASPAAFGVYALYQGICSLIDVFAGLRYETAIVVAKSGRQSRHLCALVLALGALTGLATLILGLLILSFISGFDSQAVIFYSVCAGAFPVLGAAYRAAINKLNRNSGFNWLGVVYFTNALSVAVCQIGFMYGGLPPERALILGLLAGQTIAVIVGWLAPGQLPGLVDPMRRTVHLLAVARRFKSFPRYMVAYGLNGTIRERLVHFIVGWGGGAEALGRFATAQRLGTTLNTFLYGSLGPALLSHARVHSREMVAEAAYKTIRLTFLFATPIFVFVGLNAEPLVNLLFGNRWAGMGTPLAILSVPLLVLACTAFIDRLFEFYGQQRATLRLELAFSAVLLVSLGMAAASGIEVAIVLVYSVVATIYYLYWTYQAFVCNRLPTLRLPGLFFEFLLQAAFWLVVCLLIARFDEIGLRIAALTFCVVLLAVIYFANRRRRATRSAGYGQ